MPCALKSCFSEKLSQGDRALHADREKFVWVVHFTIATFHLLAFFFTCLYLPPSSFYLVSKHLLTYSISSCLLSTQMQTCPPGRFLKCSQQPFSSEPLILDSPVLCWAGCRATVSLLALCPMLQLLSPLACRALPLPKARSRRAKPKGTSLFSNQTWSFCNSRLP